MKRVFNFSTVVIVISMFLSSCYFNPSMMLKTKKDYEYTALPDSSNPEYVISPNDVFSFRLLYNDGFKLIDLSSNNQGNQRSMQFMGFSYLVEFDGKVKLPLLRRAEIAGKTIRQAEQMLEKMYAAYYVKPFAMIKVLNRRVMVFPGSSGDAKIINLTNENTTLMEALAQAGGLASTGKAKKIKVIRENPKKKNGRDVYLIDLSKIDGLEQAELILQANDIIYVDPVPEIASKAMTNIAPYLSLLATVILVFSLAGVDIAPN